MPPQVDWSRDFRRASSPGLGPGTFSFRDTRRVPGTKGGALVFFGVGEGILGALGFKVALELKVLSLSGFRVQEIFRFGFADSGP